MSADLLDEMKRQTQSLTLQERAQLAAYLAERLQSEHQASPVADDGGREVNANDDLRQERMAWLKSNQETHGGRYVALDGAQLVGVGITYREAREAARASSKPEAFVTYLPKPDEVAQWGGWG